MAIPGRITFGCCLAAVTAFLNPGAIDRALADVGGSASGRTAVSEVHHVPLFPPASDGMRQGFVRVINRTGQAGEVLIHAVDDAGARRGPVTLELAGGQTAHFNSEDLEGGNAGKGLTGQVGPGSGTWRLELESGLDVEVLSYIRTEDGFLTAMHDVAPPSADGFVVATFNPAANRNQRSSLRLVNPNSVAASVTVVGIDDEGSSPGSGVSLSIPPGAARTLTAPQLEEGGADLSGALGDGAGKWRLLIDADRPIQALSLLTSPTGHLTNLSTAPDLRRPQGEPAADTRISGRRTIATAADHLSTVEAADVDGDGLIDIVAGVRSDHDEDRIVWFENLGGATFSGERPIGTGIDRIDLVSVADLDQDGDPDVVHTARQDDDYGMAWRENLGGGRFSDERVIAVEADSFWTRLAAADLDSDGDNDIVATLFDGGIPVWYENAGNAAWTERPVAEIVHLEGSLQVADFDSDGDPDLAMARPVEGSSGMDLVWLENLGGGRFATEPTVVEARTYIDGLLAADLDADGDADVVSISSSVDEVAWFENLGGGRFSERRLIASRAHGVSTVDAADFDGDGDLDLVCFFYVDGKIAWFRNLGGGAFSEERVIATQAGNPALVEPADVDGDGDLDVLVGEGALTGPETIAWYENLRDADASIRARIVPGVGQFWVSWNLVPESGGGAGHRFRVTAVSDDGRHRRECTATFSQGCTVTRLTPGVGYRVTVAVEGDAFRAATLTARPLKDPAVATDFSEPLVISAESDSHGPGTLLAVDLDGDGDTDLVDDPRGGDPQPVAWWENAGGGSFPERRVVSSNRVHAVEAADLDGDGDLDLLSAAAYDRELSWYENLGSGAFSAPKAIATDPGAVWSVRTSDLDGDGDPDVIAPSDVDERDGEVRWYENRGGGAFGPARRVAESTYQTRDLFAADLDGDGDADLIGAYSGYGTKDYYQAEWFENLGRGEFSDRRIVRIEDRDNSALRPVDLDGDGAVDLLAVGLSDGEVAWYRNLGGGRFSGQRVIVEHGRYGGFDTADLDGDGDTDLVYNARLRDTIAWHENLGGGVFSGERLIADDFDGDWSIVAADLDSSGDPDVLARYWNRGQLVWFRNQGTSRAPTEAPANIRVVAGVGLLWVSWEPLAGLGDSERAQARYIVTALAADGSVAGECIATELIGCSITGLTPGDEYEVTVQAENEAGAGPVSAAVSVTAAVDTQPPGTRFGPQRVITTQALEPKSVRAADLDDDSDLDALSASSEDDTIAWHENTATGFLPVRHVITASADGAGHVRTGDLDDDGDSDVVSASFDDQIVAWYENLGAGAFAAQSVIAMNASNLGSLDLADLDDDGDLDVLIAGPGEYGLEWYENLGGAVFAGPRNVAESNYNSGAIASPADLDADGDLDVLTTTSFNNGIGWHENLGSGSFSPARTITTGLESNATLSTADVDGDGDPDILHGSHREDTVAWYENRGGGEFLGRRVIATGIDDLSAVTPGDLDADGDMDIIIASYDDDRIAWYENLERGRFSGARVVTMDADGAIDAIAADLDGDGDADILAAASVGNTVGWYENLGPSN